MITTTLNPVETYLIPAPVLPAATHAATATLAPVIIEHVTPAPVDAPVIVNTYVAPSPVIKYIASARVAPSLQSLSADINPDIWFGESAIFYNFFRCIYTKGCWLTAPFECIYCARQSGPSGTDRCRRDDTEHCEIFQHMQEQVKVQEIPSSRSRSFLNGLRSRSGTFLFLRLWKRHSRWCKLFLMSVFNSALLCH